MTQNRVNGVPLPPAAAPSEPLLRRVVRGVCLVAAWFATLGMLTLAALRIFYHDGTLFLTQLNAFTLYDYLPAYACLLWAMWQRRWSLAVASAVVVGCHVMWIAPDFLRDRRFDTPTTIAAESAPASRTVRIFFANVREDNEHYDALLQEIAAANPDVIVLVEYGWGWHIAFLGSPMMKPYTFGSGHLQSHIGAVNLFSRLPLKTETQSWLSGRAVHTVDIDIGRAQPLRLIGLHAPRPINLPRYHYREYWQQTIPLLLSQQGPLVVLGDINATQHSRVYQELTAGRLRSAHQDRGRGYAVTWPNGRNSLPPIRIDQAFVSPEMECLSISEGGGLGSDHKPLILDVRIRPTAGPPPQR